MTERAFLKEVGSAALLPIWSRPLRRHRFRTAPSFRCTALESFIPLITMVKEFLPRMCAISNSDRCPRRRVRFRQRLTVVQSDRWKIPSPFEGLGHHGAGLWCNLTRLISSRPNENDCHSNAYASRRCVKLALVGVFSIALLQSASRYASKRMVEL